MAGDVLRFDDWLKVVREQVPADKQAAYVEAITKFRYWLRQRSKPMTLEAFREHVDWKQSYLPADRFAIRREALRWYYKQALGRVQSPPGQKQSVDTTATLQSGRVRDMPLDGALDLGATPWERKLVRREELVAGFQ